MSLYTLTSKETPGPHVKAYGGYNDVPTNWRKITEADFAKSMFFTYTPEAVEDRQFVEPSNPTGPMISARLFFMHDGTGVALSRDFWAGTVQYFAFGCAHEYRELTQTECEAAGIRHWGRCFHVNKCTICEYVYAYDSSD